MSPYEQARNNALAMIQDDYSELWWVASYVEKEFSEASRDQLREITKRIVEELMADHGVKILDVETELPLPIDSRQGGRMVDEVFANSEGLPTIGDGFWLGIPLSPAP